MQKTPSGRKMGLHNKALKALRKVVGLGAHAGLGQTAFQRDCTGKMVGLGTHGELLRQITAGALLLDA